LEDGSVLRKMFLDKLKKFYPKRPLYAQLLFTAIAFAAMVILSYIFMRDIIRKNLVRNAESTLSLVQNQVENDLNVPKMYLSGFSRTVRTSLLQGVSRATLEEYFQDLNRHLHSNTPRLNGFEGLSGYIESMPGGPFLIQTFDWKLPDDYDPAGRPWYLNALRGNGEIEETITYNDVINNENILMYSLCVLDDNGKRLAVICIRLKLDVIGESVVKTALERGGYGMLIDRPGTGPDNFKTIAHPNPVFVGMDFRSPSIPVSIFAPAMMEGINVSEGSVVNYTGDKSIVFFRKLTNGWYLGLVTAEAPFYQDLTNMAAILIVLGTAFAVILVGILIRIDSAKNKSDLESRHKSAFLANMSHEIRTPMNAIIGMTTIGKSAPDIERKDHCFSKIQDASNHLLGVINDILDMSKIEANKFELSPTEFNFEKMLQRIVNVVNFRVDEKKQKFHVYIDQAIPKTLIGDDQRLAQVITNLLSNAIKFTADDGTINLETRFVEEYNNVCTIQVSVTDNGIGIRPEQQERMFSSFEQAETTTTRRYGGTGLGLAISKRIVEMMNGRIWLVSEFGVGSTFTFIFQMQRGVETHRGLLSPDINLSNVRIMAVDDDKTILEYFTEISHEFKVHCDTALSGKEAIALIEKNGHYHIYFIDWKMPEMDGIQLATELKKRHESTKSVVIMITAAEWTTVESEARAAGVDKFLSKPLFPSHIADIINEALGIEQKRIDEKKMDINGIFAGRRVLLVEDVEINRDIVKALLEPTLIDIECAENGKEAVRMFSEQPYKYDIIFMDIQMPEMDGYEATRRIRALNVPQAQTIRIIAMTANVFREDIERCLECGMDNHLGKPLDFEDVIGKLRQYLPKK